MNCKKCGKQLAPNENVCSNCGEPVNMQPGGVNQAPMPNMAPDGINQPQANMNNGMQQGGMMNGNMAPNPNMPAGDIPQNPGMPTNNMAQPGGMPNQPMMNNQGLPNPQMQQPMQNQEQVPGTPEMQQAPTAPAPAKTKSNKDLILIIVIVVLAIVAGIVVFKLLKGNNIISGEKKNSDVQTTSTTGTEDSNVVSIAGMNFTIPDGYAFEAQGSQALLYNSQKCFLFEVLYDNFDLYKSNTDAVVESMKTHGVEVYSSKVEKVGNREYLILDIKIDGQNRIAFYTKLQDNIMGAGDAMNSSGTLDHSMLEDLSLFFNSASNVSNFNKSQAQSTNGIYVITDFSKMKFADKD